MACRHHHPWRALGAHPGEIAVWMLSCVCMESLVDKLIKLQPGNAFAKAANTMPYHLVHQYRQVDADWVAKEAAIALEKMDTDKNGTVGGASCPIRLRLHGCRCRTWSSSHMRGCIQSSSSLWRSRSPVVSPACSLAICFAHRNRRSTWRRVRMPSRN